MKGGKANKETESIFESLLQRIEKQYNPAEQQEHALSFIYQRPPDEAASALGEQLALTFQDLSLEVVPSMEKKALVTLTSPHMNPSVIQSFLTTLWSTSISWTGMDWLPSWILHTDKKCSDDSTYDDEEQTNWDALAAMIHCYAKCVRRHLKRSDTKKVEVSHEIAVLFRKLQSSPAQIAMLREFSKVAFFIPENDDDNDSENDDALISVRQMLSPLVTTTVLSMKQRPQHQQVLFLEGLWREAWSAIPIAVEQGLEASVLDILEWMTNCLVLYLSTVSCYSRGTDKIGGKEIAHRWLIQLLEMATFLEQSLESESPELQKLSRWLSQVVSGPLIRIFATVPTFRISLQPVLLPVQAVIQRLNATTTCKFTLDATESHRIATMLLSNPVQEDVKELILLLASSLSAANGTSSIVQFMLRGTGSMLVSNSNYSNNCAELIRSLPARASQKSQQNRGESSSSIMRSLLQIVEEEPAEDVKVLLDFLGTEGISLNTRQLSVTQQMGALLLGVGLLDADHGWKDSTRAYFDQLLSHYPQLGVPLLPILIESVNRASVRGDGASLIEQLGFLCGTIIQEPQCAQEVWNLLGVKLMQKKVPAGIRASIIRLFPKICVSNKRLYKRVVVAMGNSLVFNTVAPGQQEINDQNEIRLAVAATVADLARDDLIRDVTDVIGWIQDFIEDCGWVRSVSTLDKNVSTVKAAIVHYALLSLHYLVVSQELDYNVVMVVLRKRLCDIHSIEEVTKLPPLVLEALVVLLGDGESGDDESDSGEEREQQFGIHPQVRQSVASLIQLGLCEILHPDEHDCDPHLRQLLSNCRENIYASLSRYSLEALNLDDEGIKTACAAINNPEAPALPESGRQYNALIQVIEKGIQQLHIDSDAMMHKDHFKTGSASRQGLESLKALTSKILLFEEDTLGSSLWQKRSKAKQRTKSVPSEESFDKSSYIEALPSSQTIYQLYNENRSTVTAMAGLLCADSKPISSVTALATDVCNESSDALINAMYVQSWLHTSRSLLEQLVASQSSSEGLENILTAIRDWRYTHDNTDNMNMALSALALYIPVVLGPYGDHSAYVVELCDEVYMAYQDHEFENQDLAKLCLAFVAVCSVMRHDFNRVTEVVEFLEKSVTAYGGRVSFGACFGLASIAQAFCTFDGDSSRSTAVGFIRRIIGFLLKQLVSCIKGSHPAMQRLLHCVEIGSIDPEVIDELTALRKRTIEVVESKREITKIIFISLGLCVRALAIVNDELLLGMYCLLDCLPWGSGKGFALPSILQTCLRRGLFEDSEVQKIYSTYTRIFQDGLDNSAGGLDDILYVVTATNAKVIPHSTQRFLVGNPRLFDKDGRCISLVCAVCSLSSMPCLGHEAELFTDSPRLLPSATKTDIVGVSSLIMEALGASDFDLGKYSQMGVLLMGYLASLKTFIESSDLIADSSVSHKPKEPGSQQLPTPHQGTVLEILMPFVAPHVLESGDEVVHHDGTCSLAGCLEVLSLPGHFAIFHEKILGRDAMIAEVCTKLLVSQLQGRPRAVFDGKEFIDMATKIIKAPSSRLRESFSVSSSPLLLESLDTIILKLPTEKVQDAIEGVWRMCLEEIKDSSSWALSFLASIKRLLKQGSKEKSFNIAPKKLRTVQTFLLSTFEGLRNMTWTTQTLSAERAIIDLYAHCLAELPISSLIEVEFFALTDHDGFVGEALRYRCIMTLVRLDYFESGTRASSEIQAAMSWFSRQLVSSIDSTFSNSLLSVCCSIMEATESEKTDQRRSLLFMLLDNLMLIGPEASMMGLQMLGALVGQWTRGQGSDGELSLGCLCLRPKSSWQALPPRTAVKLLQLLVRDMPYNLASFAKKERITSAVSNRLHRIHSRWIEHGVVGRSLVFLRQTIAFCRTEESENDDFDHMGIEVLLSVQ